MRIFTDTNVIVSNLISRGLVADLVTVIMEDHQLVVSETVLREMRRVLVQKIGVAESKVAQYEASLRMFEVISNPDWRNLPRSLETADRLVLAAALDADADVLVTGDRDLLDVASDVDTLRILDPRTLWEELQRVV